MNMMYVFPSPLTAVRAMWGTGAGPTVGIMQMASFECYACLWLFLMDFRSGEFRSSDMAHESDPKHELRVLAVLMLKTISHYSNTGVTLSCQVLAGSHPSIQIISMQTSKLTGGWVEVWDYIPLTRSGQFSAANSNSSNSSSSSISTHLWRHSP